MASSFADRLAPGGWTVERLMGVIGFFGAMTALVFSLGVNWARVSAVDERLSAHEKVAESSYARSDVEIERFNNIDRQLQTLNRKIDEMTSLMLRRAQQQPN